MLYHLYPYKIPVESRSRSYYPSKPPKGIISKLSTQVESSSTESWRQATSPNRKRPLWGHLGAWWRFPIHGDLSMTWMGTSHQWWMDIFRDFWLDRSNHMMLRRVFKPLTFWGTSPATMGVENRKTIIGKNVMEYIAPRTRFEGIGCLTWGWWVCQKTGPQGCAASISIKHPS